LAGVPQRGCSAGSPFQGFRALSSSMTTLTKEGAEGSRPRLHRAEAPEIVEQASGAYFDIQRIFFIAY